MQRRRQGISRRDSRCTIRRAMLFQTQREKVRDLDGGMGSF